jgi:hypothetical protein
MRYSLFAALALAACTKTPSFLYGESVANVHFHVYSTNEGVYPDHSVLLDPNNPFAADPPGDQAKWDLQANAGPAVSFYSWATLNANAALGNGEDQYYTAINLQQLYQTGQVDSADSAKTLTLALQAYQAVLDYFPTSVTYFVANGPPTDLATLSYEAIVALGGKVQGNWLLVTGANGKPLAVRQ